MIFEANPDKFNNMQMSDQPELGVGEGNMLASLLERAKGGRLSADEEKEAARLTKERLLSGKAGVTEAVEAIVQLPWSVGVEALNAAWPEMKPASGRRQFLTAIGNHSSDQAHRVRLSLARGLHPVDPAASVKVLSAVCEEMRSAEGKLQAKGRGMFSQVLIGKAKPWIANIALHELKPAESGQIAGATLEVIGTCSPLAQEGLLAWLATAGQLKEISEENLQSLQKSVSRWKPELRRQFLSKNLELPESLAVALAAEPVPQPQREPKKAAPAPEPKQQPKAAREERNRRPSEENVFDLGNVLRQIDLHVKELRSELNQAKNALRQRENGRKPSRPQPVEEIDVDGLRRHNTQLEETVQELKQQLEDLASHHEDVAQSLSAADDPTEQFKELLKIKLQKDYADFKSLAQEPPDEVFREHYRILLDNVFGILAQQGVRLE